jgi:protein-S-isoprenylcysteine O-methyltransferase Ste14
MKLMLHALAKYLVGLVLVGAMLFLPAWTWNYPNAWLFLALLFIPMLLMGLVMLFRAPDLLAKRLDGKERERTQRGVIALSGIFLPLGFVLSALDFRFAWSSVPTWCTVLGASLFLIGYGMYAEVLRENAYLSRKIEVQEGQKVIDTGLYAAVRHPMYAVTLWLFLAIPVVLGSWWALACFALYIPVIVVRIINEEKLLTRELSGYAEYKTRVKFRLVPFVW